MEVPCLCAIFSDPGTRKTFLPLMRWCTYSYDTKSLLQFPLCLVATKLGIIFLLSCISLSQLCELELPTGASAVRTSVLWEDGDLWDLEVAWLGLPGRGQQPPGGGGGHCRRIFGLFKKSRKSRFLCKISPYLSSGNKLRCV